MTRVGKIARLPRTIRDQLNHRLQDGESGQSLVTWLNAQPEVQKVLADSFGGRPVNPQNVSDWKQGGYQEWLARQDTLELARQMGEQATDLQTGDQRPLTDLLAVWLAARYATALKDLSPPSDEAGLKRLHSLCMDVVSLRWGDHSAARLRLERERFDLQRESVREKTEEEMLAWAQENDTVAKLCEDHVTPELLSAQIDAVRWRLFGHAVAPKVDLKPPPGWDGHFRDPKRPGPTPQSVIRDRGLVFPPDDQPPAPPPTAEAKPSGDARGNNGIPEVKPSAAASASEGEVQEDSESSEPSPNPPPPLPPVGLAPARTNGSSAPPDAAPPSSGTPSPQAQSSQLKPPGHILTLSPFGVPPSGGSDSSAHRPRERGTPNPPPSTLGGHCPGAPKPPTPHRAPTTPRGPTPRKPGS